MKIVFAVCTLIILVCGLAAADNCPEGKYYNAEVRKCVIPGEDPTGETERNFRRQLIAEGRAFCVDGWCCPDEQVYQKCLGAKNRGKCLKRQKCIVYGE